MQLFLCLLAHFRKVYKEFLLLVFYIGFLSDLLEEFTSFLVEEWDCPAHFVSLNTKEEDDSFFAFYRKQFNELICYRFFALQPDNRVFLEGLSRHCVQWSFAL